MVLRCSLVFVVVLLGLGSMGEVAPPSSVAAHPDAKKFDIDPSHSTALFKIKHAQSANFYGRFNKLSGSLAFDEAEPKNSSIEITVDTASVDTNSEGRDRHLRSDDFFAARKHPKLTFKSRSWKKVDDGFEVEGDFVLRGVKKTITAKVEMTGKGEFRGERIGFEARFSIKRSDYGVKAYPKALGDDVEIVVAVEGLR